jgi:hypothetical protein
MTPNCRVWLVMAGLLTMVGCGDNGRRTPKSDRQYFQWRLQKTAQEYLQVGKPDPRWDANVLRAFTNMAIVAVWGDRTNTGRFRWCSDLFEATDVGCADPLVLYLQLRCEEGTPRQARAETIARWTNTVTALNKSGYSATMRFWANSRAASAVLAANEGKFTREVHPFRRAAMEAAATLMSMDDTPVDEARAMAHATLDIIENNKGQKGEFMPAVEAIFREKWKRTWQAHDVIGRFEIERAWQARGNGMADSVTKEGWKQFGQHLRNAESHLLKAWKIERVEDVAIRLMRVELGLGRGRKNLEKWFQQAMALNPASYDAAYAKYNYLAPKWHGSYAEQHAFARECVRNKKWRGNVPLIMTDYYDDVASASREGKAIFKKQEVWEDIHAAMERFFELNPLEEGWHHNYFWYAYMADQWEIARRELDAMGPIVNYEYFGGQHAFTDMAEEVRAKTGGPTTK